MNKKNGGNVPVLNDERAEMVPVGCGKCMECRKQNARNWQVRLLEEVREKRNGKFVTLTFKTEQLIKLSNEIKGLSGYELDNEIATLAMRRFLERWRKEYGKSIRHWMITELGSGRTEHIHIHGIVWTEKKMEDVERVWQYGYVWKGKEEKGGITNYVNEKTVNYITKYVSKADEKHKEYKPKVLTSPGIGEGYTRRMDAKSNKYKGEETKEYYTTRTGHKMAMPSYWRNKIYNEEEREKLWMNMLDKEIRYVNKKKVSIKNGEEEYYRKLKGARERNKSLGYGNDEINWERKQYENSRRRLIHKKRWG